MIETSEYSKIGTEEHPIAKEKNGDCVKPINHIVERESKHKETKKFRCFDYKKIKFEGAEAIDFDCITEGEDGCKSVDMIIVLYNSKSNNYTLLLVELKLCVQNVNDLGKNKEKELEIIEDVKEKLKDSKDKIEKKLKDKPNFHKSSVLIFCDTHKPRLENNIKRVEKQFDDPVKILTLQKFKQAYF